MLWFAKPTAGATCSVTLAAHSSLSPWQRGQWLGAQPWFPWQPSSSSHPRCTDQSSPPPPTAVELCLSSHLQSCDLHIGVTPRSSWAPPTHGWPRICPACRAMLTGQSQKECWMWIPGVSTAWTPPLVCNRRLKKPQARARTRRIPSLPPYSLPTRTQDQL